MSPLAMHASTIHASKDIPDGVLAQIFWLRRHGTGPDVDNLDWVEDLAWQHRLSRGWDLAAVREVCTPGPAACTDDTILRDWPVQDISLMKHQDGVAAWVPVPHKNDTSCRPFDLKPLLDAQ